MFGARNVARAVFAIRLDVLNITYTAFVYTDKVVEQYRRLKRCEVNGGRKGDGRTAKHFTNIAAFKVQSHLSHPETPMREI